MAEKEIKKNKIDFSFILKTHRAVNTGLFFSMSLSSLSSKRPRWFKSLSIINTWLVDKLLLKLVLLPKLLNYNEDATAYVESHMPEGIERVDGTCIRPILKKVVNDVLASLPQPEITEEV